MASRKYCIVPLCENNTVKFPNKYFFGLPMKEVKRNVWLKAMGCDMTRFSTKTKRFICEDHFDLEKDSENFLEMKLMGAKPRLRKDVIPHILSRLVIENEREVGLRRKLSDFLESEDPHFYHDLRQDAKKCFVPTCSNTSMNSKKLFISVPKQEDTRKSWYAAVGRTRVQTTNSYPGVCCEDHFNMQEDCENWMEYRMKNVKMRMKKDARPHLHLRRRIVTAFEKSFSQLSPNARKRRLEDTDSHRMNTSDFIQEEPLRSDDKISETIAFPPSEKSLKKYIRVQHIPNHAIVSHKRKQQKSNTKILFRNNNEELCIIGSDKWSGINEKDKANEGGSGKVESKRKTEHEKQTEPITHTKSMKDTNLVIQEENEPAGISKQPQLSICEGTGSNKIKAGEYFSVENEVNAEKAKSSIEGESLCEISDTSSVSENFICEETGLFKNSKGEYFTDRGQLLDLREVEAEKKKAKIRGENLFQITDICTVQEEAVEKAENKEVSDETITSPKIPIVPSSPLKKLQELVSSTESIKCIDKNLNDGDLHKGLIDIKEEPLEMTVEEGRVEFNYVPQDDEETLTSSESASYENLEGLLDSLNTYESGQYIDVPEFVQINHFTLKDLENLKKQQQSLRVETRRDWFDLQSSLTSLPYEDPHDNKDINLKMLLAENTSPNPMIQLDQNTLLSELQTVEETEDLYRSWNKNYPVKMPVPRVMKKSAPKPRRRKVKIIAVNENETDTGKKSDAKISHPSREICVLFTNYSYDGLYINDHDYLATPYKRNKILMKENGQSFCMCFICGYKHSIEEHVIHMNLHEPKCRVCNINLGTGYMLNLHMRTHTKPCKFCTDLVPYHEMPKHENEHREEELKYEEKGQRKRKKKDDKDQKPVYFPLVCDSHRRPKILRSRLSSSQVPSKPLNVTDSMLVKIVDETHVESDRADMLHSNIENFGKNSHGDSNVETNDTQTNNMETNNVETNNEETNKEETNNEETNNLDTNKIETNCSETNKAEANDTITKKSDANTTEVNESESIEQKKNSPKRKGKRRRTGLLSKEECDLEEKLLKITQKSREHADKRVLRSSFVKKSSECDEMEQC